MHLTTIAGTARQRRFRACAAAYIGWTSKVGEDRAATQALTRRQQASRALAAEMLAPKELFLERAPQYGFDSDDLEEIAGDFICPVNTVTLQAHRAGITLQKVITTLLGQTWSAATMLQLNGSVAGPSQAGYALGNRPKCDRIVRYFLNQDLKARYILFTRSAGTQLSYLQSFIT